MKKESTKLQSSNLVKTEILPETLELIKSTQQTLKTLESKNQLLSEMIKEIEPTIDLTIKSKLLTELTKKSEPLFDLVKKDQPQSDLTKTSESLIDISQKSQPICDIAKKNKPSNDLCKECESLNDFDTKSQLPSYFGIKFEPSIDLVKIGESMQRSVTENTTHLSEQIQNMATDIREIANTRPIGHVSVYQIIGIALIAVSVIGVLFAVFL